jgi:hypothetical protein
LTLHVRERLRNNVAFIWCYILTKCEFMGLGFWEHAACFMEHFQFKLSLVRSWTCAIVRVQGQSHLHETHIHLESKLFYVGGAPTQNQCFFSGQNFPKFWPIQRVFCGKKKTQIHQILKEKKKISNHQIFMISSSR